MNELEKIKILATANMKIAGVPALHKTLEQLLIDEKYEELNVMNQVYENEKGGRVEAEVMLICPDCGGKAELKDSAMIYGKSYGLAYVCENYPKCDNFVGCHKGTGKPMGTLANAKLRSKRKETHSLFDQLWKGESRKMNRGQAYKFMADTLGIDQSKAHIALLTFAECDKLVKAILGAKST